MVSVCFYFQVHQPHRLKNYKVFDIGKNHDYFDDRTNQEICRKVADKCYLPANRLMLRLINRHKSKDRQFKIAYSISGTAIDQFEKYSPEVIESFQHLNETGCVEFLSETYYHSLSFLKSKKEFSHQVNLHKRKMKDLFGVSPKIFRNTELIFNNELANFIQQKGFKGILAEGADHILEQAYNKSSNFVYTPKTAPNLKLLLKNYKLSDDIAFRFSNREWPEWPLTAEKFAGWISQNNGNGEVINLFMDYETFGEHQWEETGIFKFMEQLPEEILKCKDNNFMTPSQVIKNFKPKAEIDMHNFVSWADVERDLSAWQGNDMQTSALNYLFELEKDVMKTNKINGLDNQNKRQLINDWRKLQTSDHFYYMCTKWFSDGDVHKYFNPYDSPYDCFISFMNIINDMRERVKGKEGIEKLD